MTKRRIQRLLLGLVIVPLATALGVEVATRVIDRFRGKPWDADASRAWVEQVCEMVARRPFGTDPNVDATTNRLLLQPYFGWEYDSTQSFIAEETSWFADPRSKVNYDVYVVGGSVAAGFVKFGRDRLVADLTKDPRFAGRRLRVRSLAAGGYKQPQQATFLAYALALGFQPDAVIDIDGFNEAALGWQNAEAGTHPLYPSVSHWSSAALDTGYDWEVAEQIHAVRVAQDRASQFGEWFLRSGLWRSCFLDHALSLRLERLRRTYARAYTKLSDSTMKNLKSANIDGPSFPAEPDAVDRIIVDSWVECSTSLHAMCKERGIAYLHVLQPTLHDQGSKPLTPKEIETGTIQPSWKKGVQRVYPLLRQASPRLEQRGVPFLDASLVFRDHPEELYYDLCHFEEPGNVILADAIAARFLALLPP